MSTLQVSKRFSVESSPERVWGYLVRPDLVVCCLPGATLQESSEDGRLHKGAVTVKVGPLGVSYRGSAEFVEVDDGARRLRVKGKGREKTGAGAVSMELLVEVAEGTGEGGPCEVRIDATIQLAGKIVTFGRGMIDAVTEEVLSSFTDCLCETLASEEAGEGGDEASGATTVVSSAGGDEPVGSHTVPSDSDSDSPPPRLGLGLLFRALLNWLGRVFRRP